MPLGKENKLQIYNTKWCDGKYITDVTWLNMVKYINSVFTRYNVNSKRFYRCLLNVFIKCLYHCVWQFDYICMYIAHAPFLDKHFILFTQIPLEFHRLPSTY